MLTWDKFNNLRPHLLMFFSSYFSFFSLFKTPPSEEPTLCIVDRRKARKFLFVERGNGSAQDFIHIRYKLNIVLWSRGEVTLTQFPKQGWRGPPVLFSLPPWLFGSLNRLLHGLVLWSSIYTSAPWNIPNHLKGTLSKQLKFLDRIIYLISPFSCWLCNC